MQRQSGSHSDRQNERQRGERRTEEHGVFLQGSSKDLHLHIYAYMHACMHARMRVRMHACVDVCMYVCNTDVCK